MEIGETLAFHPDDLAKATLAYYASRLSKSLGREYHCRTVRTSGLNTIKREA